MKEARGLRSMARKANCCGGFAISSAMWRNCVGKSASCATNAAPAVRRRVARETVRATENGLARVALVGGAEVLALPVKVDGGRTTLSIRPERVTVGGLDGDAVNRLPGRVVEPIYHGDHVRLRLSVGGNDDFTVKMPVGSADLVAVHARQPVVRDHLPGRVQDQSAEGVALVGVRLDPPVRP